MSYSYFLPSRILKRGVVELENAYRRARMIREMECLSSRNGLKSLFNLRICERYAGEKRGFSFLLPKQEQECFKSAEKSKTVSISSHSCEPVKCLTTGCCSAKTQVNSNQQSS